MSTEWTRRAAPRIEAVRRFNRFYTRRIGVLHEGLLDSPYSLAEVRVLYELAHRPGVTARDLARDLGLDAGYLSRILQSFVRRGFVRRETSTTDARQRPLSLTAEGRRAFAPLDRRSAKEVAAMLAPLSRSAHGAAHRRDARHRADPATPDGGARARSSCARTARATWDGSCRRTARSTFASTDGTSASRRWSRTSPRSSSTSFDPARERCWIAERDGERVGSVFLVKKSATVAKLRLLIVDPKARGAGLGATLVGECIRFARECGYQAHDAVDAAEPRRGATHLRGRRLRS